MHEPDLNSNFNHLDGLVECPSYSSWVGDGTCDDITNIIECDYDGGDCCMSDIETQFCIECFCHSSTTITPLLCNGTLAWIGDGFCDDATNNQGRKRLAQKIGIKNDAELILINISDCNYDGGDCCGDDINISYCSDCTCNDNQCEGMIAISKENLKIGGYSKTTWTR